MFYLCIKSSNILNDIRKITVHGKGWDCWLAFIYIATKILKQKHSEIKRDEKKFTLPFFIFQAESVTITQLKY